MVGSYRLWEDFPRVVVERERLGLRTLVSTPDHLDLVYTVLLKEDFINGILLLASFRL